MQLQTTSAAEAIESRIETSATCSPARRALHAHPAREAALAGLVEAPGPERASEAACPSEGQAAGGATRHLLHGLRMPGTGHGG